MDKRINNLRALAIIGVVGIHVFGYFSQMGTINSLWFLTAFIDSTIMCAVPCFVFISGYVLTSNKYYERYYKSILKRVFIKILIPYFIMSIIYIITKGNSLKDTFKYLLTGSAEYHLYFIPIIIFFYVTYKINYSLVRKLGTTYLIMSGIFQLLYIFRGLLLPQITNSYFVNIGLSAFQVFFYFNLGIYCVLYSSKIMERVNKISMKKAAFIYALSGLVVVFEWYYGVKKFGGYYNITFQWQIPLICYFIFHNSIGIMFYYKVADKLNNKILQIVSEQSYWIYLIHVLIINYVLRLLNRINVTIERPLFYLLLFTITFVGSIFIISIIGEIIGVSKNNILVNKLNSLKLNVSPIFLILILGSILRVYYFFNFGGTFALSPDGQKYIDVANNIVNFGKIAYTTSRGLAMTNDVMPLYPIFLSVFIKLFGNNTFAYNVVGLIQVILSIGIIYLIYKISINVFNNKYCSIIAAFIVSIYPVFFWSSSYILTEVLYAFLFLLFIYVTIKNYDKQNAMRVTIIGIFLAIITLIRPASFVFIIIYPAYIFWKVLIGKEYKRIKLLLYYFIGFALPMIPWWVLNYSEFNRFILLSMGSIDPKLAGMFRATDDYAAALNYITSKYGNMDSLEYFRQANNYMNSHIVDMIRNNPIDTLKWYVVEKFWILWKYPWESDPNMFCHELSFRLHKFIVVLGFGSFFLIVKDIIKKNINEKILFLFTIVVLYSMSYQMYLVNSRYNLPCMPVLIVLTVYIIYCIREKNLSNLEKVRSLNK